MHWALELCRLIPKLRHFTQNKLNNLVRDTQNPYSPNIIQIRMKRGERGGSLFQQQEVVLFKVSAPKSKDFSIDFITRYVVVD